jgi:hypothetical protein
LQRLAAADAADLEAFARLHEGPDTPQPAVLSGLARKIGSCLASGRPELD